MSVGTPDFPPAQHVLDVVSEAAKNPEEYKYSLGDTGELLSAVEGWYQNRYGVTLQDDESFITGRLAGGLCPCRTDTVRTPVMWC